MAATQTRIRVDSVFGDLLAEAIESSDYPGVRSVARAWAEQHGGKLESRRRLLIKYLREGVSPGDQHREEIAGLLGLPVDHFADDAEEIRAKQAVADALAPLVDVLYRLARDAAQKGRNA